MASQIASFTLRSIGSMVALRRDGTIAESVVKPGALSGEYSNRTWRDVDLTGVEPAGVRVVQVAERYDAMLVVLTSTGQMYVQVPKPGELGKYTWQRIATED